MRIIYFLKPVGADGPIKIGSSVLLAERVSELSGWSPVPLELMGTVPGEIWQESYLHRCFAKDHSHKEWFRATPRLVEAILAILAAGSVEAVTKDLKPEGGIRRNPTQTWRHRRKAAA